MIKNLFKKENTFEQEIREVFAKIISDNNFILTKRNKDNDVFLLSNNILLLELGEYRGETWCKFKRPTGDEMNIGYQMWHVYNFLYPNDETYVTIKENGDWVSRYEDLKIYAHMLTHKMAFILKGDYFWEKEYLEKQRIEEAKMEIFWSFDNETEIMKKYFERDPTWKEDLDKYIKDNGIVL
jgi:hypothetical protein